MMAASQSARLDMPGNFRFEFDSEHQILMARFFGMLTQELVEEFYRVGGSYWLASGARAGIMDGSAVTQITLSLAFIHFLARQDPAPESADRPRVLVAPRSDAFGLARMFQLVGDPKRPNLFVVRTLPEAFAVLGVQSPSFEPMQTEDRRAS
jgi:hypothetical protein